jgi:hypothetical protein
MPIGVSRGTLKVLSPATRRYKIYAYANNASVLWAGLDEIEDLAYGNGEVASVTGHTVKRYPGDPGYARGPHNRKTHVNRGKPGSSRTPGKRFWIEIPIVGPGIQKYKAYQMTYTGPWEEVIEDALDGLAPGVKIRRESSMAKMVPTPAGP